jgi:hypothetical protein
MKSLANTVRKHVKPLFIGPARKSNKKEDWVIAGEIHETINFQNKSHAVCGDLEAKSLEEQHKINFTRMTGPASRPCRNMGTEILKKFSLAMFAFALVGCGTTPTNEQFHSLTTDCLPGADDQLLIKSNSIAIGMTECAALRILGKPLKYINEDLASSKYLYIFVVDNTNGLKERVLVTMRNKRVLTIEVITLVWGGGLGAIPSSPPRYEVTGRSPESN